MRIKVIFDRDTSRATFLTEGREPVENVDVLGVQSGPNPRVVIALDPADIEYVGGAPRSEAEAAMVEAFNESAGPG